MKRDRQMTRKRRKAKREQRQQQRASRTERQARKTWARRLGTLKVVVPIVGTLFGIANIVLGWVTKP